MGPTWAPHVSWPRTSQLGRTAAATAFGGGYCLRRGEVGEDEGVGGRRQATRRW
ncbi:hypothetical protein [Oryza sativa Japonica Group]|uniref:Uncharacterized protein n=1 Tax=Oryza sativa subsp. japonica TaxID=39947 RepID=Q5QMT2_ORYSJ|nr:hypothetical protein [Oryza sativa Japonica Group]